MGTDPWPLTPDPLRLCRIRPSFLFLAAGLRAFRSVLAAGVVFSNDAVVPLAVKAAGLVTDPFSVNERCLGASQAYPVL